jgi:SAM-dependent methyltransferase
MMPDENAIRKTVRDHYAKLAQSGGKGQCCCTASPASDGGALLEASQVYAGCGSPVEAAKIRQGETVLDLGSGGGLDAFRASKLVGQSGLIIGIDATPEMIWRARETAKKHQYSNVDFRLGEIEHLPVDSNSVDVVLSNCVINLAPDKGRVFMEAFRVLRPGGRLVVSDMVTSGPTKLDRSDLTAWAGCIAGALPKGEYVSLIEKAGFRDVQITRDTPEGVDDKEAQACCSSEVESVTVNATKPK